MLVPVGRHVPRFLVERLRAPEEPARLVHLARFFPGCAVGAPGEIRRVRLWVAIAVREEVEEQTVADLTVLDIFVAELADQLPIVGVFGAPEEHPAAM